MKTYSSKNLPYPLSFDKLRMVSLVEPFAKGVTFIFTGKVRRDLVIGILC